MNMKHLAHTIALTLALAATAHAADPFDDKFRQLDELLPTPTTTRTASGAPGHDAGHPAGTVIAHHP